MRLTSTLSPLTSRTSGLWGLVAIRANSVSKLTSGHKSRDGGMDRDLDGKPLDFPAFQKKKKRSVSSFSKDINLSYTTLSKTSLVACTELPEVFVNATTAGKLVDKTFRAKWGYSHFDKFLSMFQNESSSQFFV